MIKYDKLIRIALAFTAFCIIYAAIDFQINKYFEIEPSNIYYITLPDLNQFR
jgi:hypothetical protein